MEKPCIRYLVIGMKRFFLGLIKQRNAFGDKVFDRIELNFYSLKFDSLGAVPENSKQYYGFTRFAIELNEVDDDLRKQIAPTDTRFRPDQRLKRNFQ
jgi:hypothetical protein